MRGLFSLEHNRAVITAMLVLVTAATTRAQANPPSQSPPDLSSPQADTENDPIPVMFPHPETDRVWISGQANFISQWHPAFHSPYQGRNSLPPDAQDASSRVLTLFTGLRLSDRTEVLCDVQETGGHGIGEALGIAGFTNLDVVRNPTLSKAPYVARLMWHRIIALTNKKASAERTPLSLFRQLPERRLEVRFGKLGLVDFFNQNPMAPTATFNS